MCNIIIPPHPVYEFSQFEVTSSSEVVPPPRSKASPFLYLLISLQNTVVSLIFFLTVITLFIIQCVPTVMGIFCLSLHPNMLLLSQFVPLYLLAGIHSDTICN